LVAQAGVGGGQRRHGVVLVFALRVGLEHALGTVGRGHVGGAAQVVQGDVEIVAGEDVAQVGHARAGVLGVTAVRVALGDDLEVVVRLLRGGQVAPARGGAPNLLQEHGV